MTRSIDLDAWSRRAHYELFRDYAHPWFNVTAPVDVGQAVEWCRADGHSFFAACLYCSARAANRVAPFRLRMEGGGVVEHDVVHPGSTVLRPDQTFAFAYFTLTEPFARFAGHVAEESRRVEASTGLDPRRDRTDVIHHSVLPWIPFTSFQHPRRHDPLDSVPKVVFGRHHLTSGRRILPVSVEVHHALMDGLHVARYLEAFEREMARLPNARPG